MDVSISARIQLPVKELQMGADPAMVMSRDATTNSASMDWFAAFAQQRAKTEAG